MNTAFLLMAQYDGRSIIPIELVCRDYFSHLTPPKLVQKISAGEIAIPLVRIEASQKCAKGVHLTDLASYLDAGRGRKARNDRPNNLNIASSIAFSRTGDPATGEFGDAKLIRKFGDVPEDLSTL